MRNRLAPNDPRLLAVVELRAKLAHFTRNPHLDVRGAQRRALAQQIADREKVLATGADRAQTHGELTMYVGL